MGHENSSTGSLHVYLVDKNSQPVAEFTTVDGVMEIDIAFDDTRAAAMIAGALGPLTLAMNIGIPKGWRCGSRKRFIKLLMSYGCSRNTAAEFAALLKNPAGANSYQKLFFAAVAFFAEQTAE